MKLLSVSLVCFLSSIIGWQPSQSVTYEITGHIENLPAKKVFIRVMKKKPKDNQAYWSKIDSAEVINGKFVLSKDSILVDPAWASTISYIDTITKKETAIKFSNPFRPDIHANFILENAKITLAGDARSKTGVTIKGSKETDFNFKYGLIFPTYMFQLNPRIDSLKSTQHCCAE